MKTNRKYILYYRILVLGLMVFIMGALVFCKFKLKIINDLNGYLLITLAISFGILKLPDWLYNYKIKRYARQVYYDFPLWIASLEVLIVSHTVVNTLKHSLSTCPVSILPDLKELVKKLELDPTNKQYYREFLSQYDLPEVKDMMMDLYQFNFLNKDLMIQEFKNLNIRLNKMEQTSRKVKQSQQVFLLGALNSIPLFLLGCYILLIANMLSSILMGNI